ncbi:MAG: hypothetical protein EBW68_09925, partial [Actinobacteria bacterium]|nr:hypothetical protein [Actinomycetota bacterium]
HELATGKRKIMANFKGSNSAPAWSPDGRSLLATLSRDGGSQLYLIDIASGEAKRLTQNSGIDTEPSFAPDGSKIYFVSDRGGSPQIYKMNDTGSGVERVTFSGSYNISPALSPDGRWLTYISRVGGQFKVQVMNLSTSQTSAITETTADERPSFAPNSKLIVYATVLQGREALMTTTLDGKIKARLAMTPEQRREADRAERRDQAAQRKAERIFEGKQRERDQKLARERGIEGRKVAPKDVAPAPPKAGDPADTMKRASDGFMQAVDDLRKLRVVAITNT